MFFFCQLLEKCRASRPIFYYRELNISFTEKQVAPHVGFTYVFRRSVSNSSTSQK